MFKYHQIITKSNLSSSLNFIIRKMSMDKPIETMIRKKIEDALKPCYFAVYNESYMHNVPKGAETHFKVVVVSEKFDNQTLIKRHRIINGLLEDELKNGVHALSIEAKTPAQWEESSKIVSPSPTCLGGFKK
ncbi:DNA-binding transcriptional regulator BolA [Aphidius gifuensis]|uniref:DNA-binding transcriptional regulator BolA n=1 Tax=Aphidius gifuensis TaxID=684658 RepID=UPI001CDCF578|nr:DNA-binding transcriptional regulator BolA [Aphidius gifuensis]